MFSTGRWIRLVVVLGLVVAAIVIGASLIVDRGNPDDVPTPSLQDASGSEPNASGLTDILLAASESERARANKPPMPEVSVFNVEAGGSVSGRVYDKEKGHGVYARVAAYREDNSVYGAAQQTDWSGRYRIGGLPPGFYRIAVWPVQEDGEDNLPNPAQDWLVAIENDSNLIGVDFPLWLSPYKSERPWHRPKEATSRISGVVVDTAGMPLGGVELSTLVSVGDSRYGVSAVSAADGSFLLGGLMPGEYGLSYRRGGRMLSGSVPSITVKPGSSETHARVVVEKAHQWPIASGRVVDQNGVPVSGAKVVLNTYPSEIAETDEAGRFTVKVILDRSETLYVESELHSTSEPVVVRAGMTNVDFVLTPKTLIRGRVLSVNTREPVPAFRLEVVDEEPPYQQKRRFHSHFAPDGRFRVEGVDRSTVHLRVTAAGYADRVVRVPRAAYGNSPRDVVVWLWDGAVIDGRVMNASGVGIDRAYMTLTDTNRDSHSFYTLGDGSFRLNGMWLGTFQIRAEHDDYAPSVMTIEATSSGEHTAAIVLTQGATITGTVTIDGKPAKDKTISYGALNHGSSVQTDANGRYTIAKLPVATVHVIADNDQPGGRREVAVTDVSVTELNFALVSEANRPTP